MPDPSGFRRIFTFASTTRFTGTRIFIGSTMPSGAGSLRKGARGARAGSDRKPALFRRRDRSQGTNPKSIAGTGRRRRAPVEIGHAAALEDADQDHAGEEAADMRPPGHRLVRQHDRVEELEQQPGASIQQP